MRAQPALDVDADREAFIRHLTAELDDCYDDEEPVGSFGRCFTAATAMVGIVAFSYATASLLRSADPMTALFPAAVVAGLGWCMREISSSRRCESPPAGD